ncbi:hypothetical protein DN583_31050, partial [Burkholderia multivorans]
GTGWLVPMGFERGVALPLMARDTSAARYRAAFVDARFGVEIGVQRDQQRVARIRRRRARAAQQYGRRCVGRAQLQQFAACGRDRRRAAPG